MSFFRKETLFALLGTGLAAGGLTLFTPLTWPLIVAGSVGAGVFSFGATYAVKALHSLYEKITDLLEHSDEAVLKINGKIDQNGKVIEGLLAKFVERAEQTENLFAGIERIQVQFEGAAKKANEAADIVLNNLKAKQGEVNEIIANARTLLQQGNQTLQSFDTKHLPETLKRFEDLQQLVTHNLTTLDTLMQSIQTTSQVAEKSLSGLQSTQIPEVMKELKALNTQLSQTLKTSRESMTSLTTDMKGVAKDTQAILGEVKAGIPRLMREVEGAASSAKNVTSGYMGRFFSWGSETAPAPASVPQDPEPRVIEETPVASTPRSRRKPAQATASAH